MFSIDDKEVKRFENELKGFAHRALPFATKETLNQAAFITMQKAKKDVKSNMINRNAFTVKSIQFDKAKTLNIKRQASIVGSIADYMETQEFGGTKSKPTLSTSFSAGQKRQEPRTKLSTKNNKMRNILLSKKRKKRVAKNELQDLVFKAQDAVTTGKRFIYLGGTIKREGIYKVVGGSKKFKRGWPSGAKLHAVHIFQRGSVIIPRRQWLEPNFNAVIPQLPEFYKKALIKQLKRHNLFRG